MVPPPRLRRLRLTLLALLVSLAALAWVFVRLSGPAGPAGQRAAHSIPLTDVPPWGANFFLHLEVDEWDQRKTVEEAQAAGIRWAKQHFPWYEIQPEPGEYNWSKFDRIVDLFVSHDIEVIARLDFPAAWVPSADWVPAEKVGPPNNTPPASPELYAEFVRATVTHFKGRVRFYQIWNEPNLVSEWGLNPRHPVDPAEYAALLEAAADAARDADPDVVILSAPLAINNETVDLVGNMSDLDYLRGLYQAGAAEHFDILSVNAFGLDQAPDDPPAPERLNFRRAELQRAIMEDEGDGCKAVWANEYGWNAAPPGLDSIWRSVGELKQAAWTVEGVRFAQSQWPWAGVFSIWYFRHCCQSPDDAVYHFQMLDEGFNRRRLFEAVREAAADPAVAAAGDWAERAPPVRLGRLTDWAWRWDGTADARRRGCRTAFLGEPRTALDARYIESDVAGASLSFAFRGTGIALRVRRGIGAGTLRWRLDGSEDFESSVLQGPDGWDWLVLESALAPGPHELELEVGAAGGSVAIDGFRVSTDPTADPRRPWLLTLGGLSVGLLLLAFVDARAIVRRLDPEDLDAGAAWITG
ncbi:MAG: beta-galactosidase [Caldilineae bacterium]|nr:beta-galactosidase [Chloroflexota bacterium]MCB9177465.1 beta-galactosidase [Caldilineae bacterium]